MMEKEIRPNEMELSVLRELARRYMEIALNPKNDELRDLWRRHNGLEKTRVPIVCSWFYGSNTEYSLLRNECVCKEGILLYLEQQLRNKIFHATIEDDYIFEPWIQIRAVLHGPENKNWGEYTEEGRPPIHDIWGEKQEFNIHGDGWQAIPFIYADEDIEKRLKPVAHSVNEEATQSRLEAVQDIFQDILPVSIDRRSIYASTFGGCDLSEAMGKFLGIENMYYLIYDKPELIHKLASFMQKAILKNFEQAEALGDFIPDDSLNSSNGVTYCKDLADPVLNGKNYKMKDLWLFTHGQEFTSVSPKLHKEFLLDYQLPIMKKFGLVSYGCCEDLTRKIDMLRNIPNLRRIGVPPASNVAKSAEQIGKDYVMAWRPNPALISSFDKKELRRYMEAGFAGAKGCYVDVMLKDIMTVEGDRSRLNEWTKIVKEAAEKFEG
ncbi:MAG: hypothetical protein WCI30_03625 [Clostridia bacterium]